MKQPTWRLVPRGQDGFAALLSCRALSSPTTCRFTPAHSGIPTSRDLRLKVKVCQLNLEDFCSIPSLTTAVICGPDFHTSDHRDKESTPAEKARTYGLYKIPRPTGNTGANQQFLVSHPMC